MMEDAVDTALKTGTTSDPFLARIFYARRVNLYMGGPVISPWQAEPDEDWRIAFEAIFSADSRRALKARMEQPILEARKKHPTFGKY